MRLPSLAAALALALLVAVGLAGCHSGGAAPMQLALQLTPAAPTASGTTGFRLQVKDGDGHAVTGAHATLDLVMTTMDMGVTPVPMSETSPGVYTGSGQFAMSGDWDCKVTVTAGDRTQSQTFHFKVG